MSKPRCQLTGGLNLTVVAFARFVKMRLGGLRARSVWSSRFPTGQPHGMTAPDESPTDEQIRNRARLLPEEETAGGSADPEAQAKEVLKSSEERVNASHDPPDGDDPDLTRTI